MLVLQFSFCDVESGFDYLTKQGACLLDYVRCSIMSKSYNFRSQMRNMSKEATANTRDEVAHRQNM